jgi:hypothetical protein
MNKVIADELGISLITVKAHRGKVMRKMQAASLADLVNMAARLDTALLEGRTSAAMAPVPTITLDGDANGAPHPDSAAYAKAFSGKYERRLIRGGFGHNLPQEGPTAFAQAVLDAAG